MVNIRDVANLAGVSMMTVSRVVNDNGPVSEKTRKKVLEAIRELDYIPNQLAKSLVNSTSRTVGVLFSNIFNPVYSSIISGIEKKAREIGYNIIISKSTDYLSSVQALNMLVSKMVDGLIILPVEPEGINDDVLSERALGEMFHFYEDLKKLLAKRKLPCIVVDIDIDSELVDYVCHDYVGASKIGIEYLIGRGLKNIHYINSELKQGLWKDREGEYRLAMERAGLNDYIKIHYCANSTKSAFNLVHSLLKSGEKPEAFYCGNDIIAIGAMQAISSLSLKIPQDVSVMGNDGINIGQMLIPSLTSVDIGSYELGLKSMERCHEFIEGKRNGSKLYIQSHLFNGKSVI